MSDTLPEITVLSCRFCGHVPVELAGRLGQQYPASVKVLDVGCTGSVAVVQLLRALEQGAEGVLVAACGEGNCHHLSGNQRAANRVQTARGILRSAGVAPERVSIVNLGIGHGAAFAQAVSDMTETIRKLGPLGPDKTGGEA